MAFLPRPGRHAVGPVWPLPAVPAAWHRVDSLIKQPPSALCPPGHLRSLVPDPLEGPPGGLPKGGHAPPGCREGETDGDELFLTPSLGQPQGWPGLMYGLSFPI